MFTCSLRIFGRGIGVRCEDEESFELLRECYSAFLHEPASDAETNLSYNISPSDLAEGWMLRDGKALTNCRSTADLLYDFEKTMTLQLQLLRKDLFFIHAAALSVNGRCVLISGASGSGKSTLAWSLCRAGFAYLSDELAPIEPERLHVEPYPHALCLKTEPASGPPLPESTIYTSETMHVPAYELPGYPPDRPCQIGAMVFIESTQKGSKLEIAPIRAAEAAARLYSNGLNQLAHTNSGLPTATAIAKSVTSYLMSGGTVDERNRAVQDLM